MDDFNKLIEEQIKVLPPNVIKVIADSDWLNKVRGISQKYGLNEEQSLILERETLSRLVGIDDMEGFDAELETEMNLVPENADILATEIYDQIFALFENIEIPEPKKFVPVGFEQQTPAVDQTPPPTAVSPTLDENPVQINSQKPIEAMVPGHMNSSTENIRQSLEHTGTSAPLPISNPNPIPQSQPNILGNNTPTPAPHAVAMAQEPAPEDYNQIKRVDLLGQVQDEDQIPVAPSKQEFSTRMTSGGSLADNKMHNEVPFRSASNPVPQDLPVGNDFPVHGHNHQTPQNPPVATNQAPQNNLNSTPNKQYNSVDPYREPVD